jgi:hypothetical protein
MNMDPELAKDVKRVLEVMPNIEDSCSGEELRINPDTMTYQYA